jgi:hypothetical protein
MKKAAAKEWIPNSEETDAELSEGEFTDEESMRRYYIQSRIREMEIGIKKRRKSAKKAEKRMGGPPKIWSEEANRKRAAQMAKGETMKKEEKVTKKVEEKEVKTKAEKPVKEKASKKEKSTKKEKPTKGKAVKGKKEKKERKSRGPVVIDGKITVLAKENPKRKGTNAFKKFELYKKHKNIASFLEAGGKRSSLRYDEKHGYIKISGVVKKGEKGEKGEKAKKAA